MQKVDNMLYTGKGGTMPSYCSYKTFTLKFLNLNVLEPYLVTVIL